MPYLTKRLLIALLTPAAVIRNGCAGLTRLWAHTRLRAALGGRLDPSVVALGVPEIHGTGNIVLGKNLYLYRDLHLETQESGRIAIGDGVVVSRGTHLVSFAEIVVEEGAMIGEYASLRDANHKREPGRSVRETGHSAMPIRIGRNAWIGRGVTILAGVTVGEGAVVGANAVVTRDVAPGAVVVGVPAHPLLARRSARDEVR
jgi:acetyltransferase-like isoleucine patch superfamily enzyme